MTIGRRRLIARLDIKAPNLIKGIHLEGLRVVGDPKTFALKYYESGLDELIYMDAVASLYQRNSLADLVRSTAENVFIPLTVGGGIRTVDDVELLLRSGADKIAINSAAHASPALIGQVAERFGAQCMVLSIEAKRTKAGGWEAYVDNGREHTGRDVIEWAKSAVTAGAGEILLTSIDQEGTRKGYDIALVRAVSEAVSVPVIASGGMGQVGDLVDVFENGKADAAAVADCLHYDRVPISDMRRAIPATSTAVRG